MPSPGYGNDLSHDEQAFSNPSNRSAEQGRKMTSETKTVARLTATFLIAGLGITLAFTHRQSLSWIEFLYFFPLFVVAIEVLWRSKLDGSRYARHSWKAFSIMFLTLALIGLLYQRSISACLTWCALALSTFLWRGGRQEAGGRPTSDQ
jgi:hypothetical protein